MSKKQLNPKSDNGFNGLKGKVVQAMIDFDYRPGLYVRKGSLGVVEEDLPELIQVHFPDATIGPDCAGPYVIFTYDEVPEHKTIKDKMLWACQLVDGDMALDFPSSMKN